MNRAPGGPQLIAAGSLLAFAMALHSGIFWHNPDVTTPHHDSHHPVPFAVVAFLATAILVSLWTLFGRVHASSQASRMDWSLPIVVLIPGAFLFGYVFAAAIAAFAVGVAQFAWDRIRRRRR